MADKNLKYFMRPEAKEEKIIEIPGPDTIRDEKGEVVKLQVRQLHNDKILEIHSMYKTKAPLKDKKGNYVVQGGQVVFRVETDTEKVNRRLLVEALAYPDLKDEELMKYFDCLEITDMPLKVFATNDELRYVQKKVFEAIGILDAEDDNVKKETEDAKNL